MTLNNLPEAWSRFHKSHYEVPSLDKASGNFRRITCNCGWKNDLRVNSGLALGVKIAWQNHFYALNPQFISRGKLLEVSEQSELTLCEKCAKPSETLVEKSWSSDKSRIQSLCLEHSLEYEDLPGFTVTRLNNWISPSTSYTFTVTATNAIGTSSASAASNSITTLGTGISPLFSSASSYDGRFTVQIKDYDSAFTYAVTSTAGQASISSSGLVTVTGLGIDQSVTVTVTTTRTGYASGSGSVTGRSQVAPMLPTNKPVVTLSDTLLTCTIGSYSATPTSAAFSLFVDGKHISSNFSALGDYLPDWIIPWATTSTITRTASLTSATWTMSDAYKGKAITCSTLAYSKNAIGFTASQVMVAR